MEKTVQKSFRSLPLETQREIRRTAIKMWRHGSSHAEIQSALDISRNTLQRTITAWKKGGQKALASMGNKGGRPAGSGCLLTPEQENSLLDLIADHVPGEYGFKFDLWNRDSVRLLVRRTFDIELARTTVALYLKRWGVAGLRPSRSSKDGWSLNPEEKKGSDTFRRGFPRGELAAIQAEARERRARIFWVGGGPLKKGIQAVRSRLHQQLDLPILPDGSARISILSAISAKGDFFFEIIKKNIDSDLFIRFAERLLKQVGQPVLLVLDGHRAHRSSKTLKWAALQEDRLFVYRLRSGAAAASADESGGLAGGAFDASAAPD